MPYYECIPADKIEGLQLEREFDVPRGYRWDGEMRVVSTGGGVCPPRTCARAAVCSPPFLLLTMGRCLLLAAGASEDPGVSRPHRRGPGAAPPTRLGQE